MGVTIIVYSFQMQGMLTCALLGSAGDVPPGPGLDGGKSDM